MSELIDVVKRGRRTSEPFARHKLHNSILTSCRIVKTPEAVAHQAADQICLLVIGWAADKPEITSDDIRRQASRALTQHHPEAAYIYQHYNVIM